MTEAAITIETHPVGSNFGKYPLAYKPGLLLLQHLIEADTVWSRCTKVQRELLDRLCRPLIALAAEKRELLVEDMPVLPAEVRSSTRGALTREGLVDNSGRVTGKAWHAWYYAVAFKERDDG